MRLIDADTAAQYMPFREAYVAIHFLKGVPTADAIPKSVLEDIKAEIEKKGFNSPMMNPVFTMTEILEIIDRYIHGEENHDNEL